VTGISQNSDYGLGLTEIPSKITVFKMFFVTVNVPYKVIRGETVCANVIVYNYDQQSISAEVTFFDTMKAFEFVETGK
jgi:CD109 antigen